MPIEIKYLSDGGIEFIGTGTITVDEIYNANNEIYSGETLLKQRYQLLNYLNAKAHTLSKENIEKLAGQDVEASKTNPNIIIAVVADSDLTYGLARMWEARVGVSGFETMVFREGEAALAWIKKKLNERKKPIIEQ